jgi:hypothetical protein
MDPDLMMVMGIVIGGFSIPSILGAVMGGRVPRAAAIAVMISGGLIVLAIRENPGGYTINDIPDVFVNVVARYIS